MNTQNHTVTVEITVPHDYSGRGERLVRVLLEDVSVLDAPARVVAATETRMELAPGKRISTTIDVPQQEVNPRHQYTVRVRAGATLGAQVQPADLVSTQSAPVLTQGGSLRVFVPLKEVK